MCSCDFMRVGPHRHAALPDKSSSGTRALANTGNWRDVAVGLPACYHPAWTSAPHGTARQAGQASSGIRDTTVRESRILRNHVDTGRCSS